MFKVTSHNASDGNILGQSLYSRSQTAYSSDYHFYFYSRTACLDKLFNESLVCKGIQLQPDISALTASCSGNFHVNKVDYLVFKGQGRYHQMSGILNKISDRQSIENRSCLLADTRVGCKQRKVCIKLGGFFVVVARAYLGDVLNSRAVLSCNKQQL